jgi:hypothetical protein
MSAPESIGGPGRIEYVPPETLDTWAIIEQFGHKKYAGKVSEHVLGSAVLIRLDVPQVTLDEDRTALAFTKYIGPSSIYCITPCSEAIARAAAKELARWNPPIPVEIPVQRQLAAAGVADVDGDDDDFDNVDLDDDERVS